MFSVHSINVTDDPPTEMADGNSKGTFYFRPIFAVEAILNTKGQKLNCCKPAGKRISIIIILLHVNLFFLIW